MFEKTNNLKQILRVERFDRKQDWKEDSGNLKRILELELGTKKLTVK